MLVVGELVKIKREFASELEADLLYIVRTNEDKGRLDISLISERTKVRLWSMETVRSDMVVRAYLAE